MSGTRAAQALMELDTELAARLSVLPERYEIGRRDVVLSIVKELVMGTWTLTLAARSAGVSEEVVVSALLYRCGIGSTVVCRREASELFSATPE